MKKLVLFTVLSTLIACGGDTKKENNSSEVATKEAVELKEPTTRWENDITEDEMTGDKTYFASNRSTNQAEFEFPYNGGSYFTLIVRSDGTTKDALITVSKGQFMPSAMGNQYVRIKYDDADPIQYSYSGTADGSADVIFLEDANQIIQKLKKAENIMIDAPFYQEGRQVMKFDTAGLDFDH